MTSIEARYRLFGPRVSPDFIAEHQADPDADIAQAARAVTAARLAEDAAKQALSVGGQAADVRALAFARQKRTASVNAELALMRLIALRDAA